VKGEVGSLQGRNSVSRTDKALSVPLEKSCVNQGVYIKQEVERHRHQPHPHNHCNLQTLLHRTRTQLIATNQQLLHHPLHIMDDRISSEARKEVNNKIAETKTSDMNRTMGAASSSKEKREQNKRDREQREKEQRERDAVCSPQDSSQT
jgi:hypothetical protein